MPPPCLLHPAPPAQVTPPSSSDDLTRCFDASTTNRSSMSANSPPAAAAMFDWKPSNRLFHIPSQNAVFRACTASISASSSGHGINASDNLKTSPKDSSSESEQVAVSTKSISFLRESNDTTCTDDSKGNVSDDDQSSTHKAALKADIGQKHECDLAVACRNGRKGDPRMNVAVALKSTFPTMSLGDALKAGGFKFPANCEKSFVTENNIFDADNISLQQRKNQLNRRIRYAKKFAKKTTNKTNTKRKSRKHSRQQPKRNCREDVATISGDQSLHVPVLPSFPGTIIEMPSSTACQPSLREPQYKLPSVVQRDSFLEEILELPGLDGLPDYIL